MFGKESLALRQPGGEKTLFRMRGEPKHPAAYLFRIKKRYKGEYPHGKELPF